VLLRAGVQADLAGSGTEALQMVDAVAYDAVLMDIQMPGMDGYEATARIRARAQHAQLPLIAMTAHAVAGFRESSLGMGMNDYVTKPIDPERLFTVLAGQLRRPPQPAADAATATATGADAANPASAAAGIAAIDTLPGMDMEAALERLGGNRKLLEVLLKRFVTDFEASPELLLAALDHGAYGQAALLVHKVRGAAGNLSMTELHHTATELEQRLSAAPDTPLDDALAAYAAALETVLDALRPLQDSTHSASVSP
jgi:CheY-like chemotaxis protein